MIVAKTSEQMAQYDVEANGRSRDGDHNRSVVHFFVYVTR